MKRTLRKLTALAVCLLLGCALPCGCAGRADRLGAPDGTPEALSHGERESDDLAALRAGAVESLA